MNSPDPAILLVDDEPRTLLSFSVILRSAGLKNVLTLEESRQVLPLLARQPVAVMVLDLFMPHLSGLELLPRIIGDYPEMPVIFMTAAKEVDTAVSCMKQGAFDYLVKPVEKNRFLTSVEKALEFRRLRGEVSTLKHYLLSDRLEHAEAFREIVTASRRMKAIFQYIEAIATSDQPVLVTGETGVGKDLVAKAIHALSGRSGAYVTVNIAGLDEVVFSDTLFGHVKGAYTGAGGVREGLIAKAAAGTFFLDEIGDLDQACQVKLLRLLQERNYYPLGSDSLRTTDARVVVATNQEPNRMQQEGRLRKDLYFRLRTHHIHIPPLRERREDIPLLLAHFLAEAATRFGKATPTPPKELITLLTAYPFPGNIRELKAMVYDAVARHDAPIVPLESFQEAMVLEGTNTGEALAARATHQADLVAAGPPLPTLKEAEASLIEEALRRAHGNQGTAALLLGLTRQALNKRLIRGAEKKAG